MTDFMRDGSHLAYCPPVEKWDDWVELDPEAWPRRVEKHYQLVPTVCFNCESACGLLAYVNKATGDIDKFEGNPMHPASRGRLCAKGPATINQIHDPDRVLYPMKRVGERGTGKWARTSWEEVLETFGARIRKAIQDGRGEEVMYHVGRPGHDFIMERTLQAWGIDGHNSHTNVCSSGIPAVALCGSSVSRSRQCTLYPAAFRASRIWTLFQPACAKDHRRKNGGCEAGRDGPAPLEHRQHGRLLDAHVSRDGSCRATRHGESDSR